jgi:putative oxidoreductase
MMEAACDSLGAIPGKHFFNSRGHLMNNEACTTKSCSLVDITLLIVRVIAGVIFFYHGAQKMFGAFGGPGLEKMMAAPPDGMGPVLGFLVSLGECFGGLGLIVGFLARFSAASNIVIMIGAIVLVHGANGFSAPTGYEYNLALIGLLAPTFLLGPGSFSIGRCLPLPKSKDSGRPIVVLE